MYYENDSITDRAVQGHMGDPDFWGKETPVTKIEPRKPALRLLPRLDVEQDIRQAEEDDHGQLQCC